MFTSRVPELSMDRPIRNRLRDESVPRACPSRQSNRPCHPKGSGLRDCEVCRIPKPPSNFDGESCRCRTCARIRSEIDVIRRRSVGMSIAGEIKPKRPARQPLTAERKREQRRRYEKSPRGRLLRQIRDCLDRIAITSRDRVPYFEGRLADLRAQLDALPPARTAADRPRRSPEHKRAQRCRYEKSPRGKLLRQIRYCHGRLAVAGPDRVPYFRDQIAELRAQLDTIGRPNPTSPNSGLDSHAFP